MIDMTIFLLWLKNFGLLVGFPVLRSVSGWAVKALDDNEISKFEWKQLLQTVIRVGSIGIMGFLGLSAVGVEQAALIAVSSSFLVDKLFHALKY